MWNPCKHGGKCIDPGRPSDCEINSICANFKSSEEKAAFDDLPDKFLLELKDSTGEYSLMRFKNKNQLMFFLTDFPHWRDADTFSLDETGQKDFKLQTLIDWDTK